MRDVADALVSDYVDVFDFALAYFGICIFIVFLSLHVDCGQFGIVVLYDGPEEDVIAVFDV